MDATLKQELEEIAELLKLFPEALQQQVFNLVIEDRVAEPLGSGEDGDQADPGGNAGVGKREAPATPAPRRTRRRGGSGTTHSLLGDLDLRASGSRPAFVDFVKEKAPTSDAEFNTIAVYYLSRLCGIADISQNHLYTCYKTAKRKVPTNMAQSVRNAHDRTSSLEFDRGPKNIRLTTIGENMVEHDLPRAGKVQET